MFCDIKKGNELEYFSQVAWYEWPRPLKPKRGNWRFHINTLNIYFPHLARPSLHDIKVQQPERLQNISEPQIKYPMSHRKFYLSTDIGFLCRFYGPMFLWWRTGVHIATKRHWMHNLPFNYTKMVHQVVINVLTLQFVRYILKNYFQK